MLNRLKVKFQLHIDYHSREMYEAAYETIMDELRGMHKALLPATSERVQKVLDRLEKTLRDTINNATIDETEREEVDNAKTVFRHRVVREFLELEKKCQQGVVKEEDDAITNPFNMLNISSLNMEGEYKEYGENDLRDAF